MLPFVSIVLTEGKTIFIVRDKMIDNAPGLHLLSLSGDSFHGLWFPGSGFGCHFNGCGYWRGSLQVVSSAGVRSLVHIPHLIHQEDRLRLLSADRSTHWAGAVLCVQGPPNLQPARALD